METMTPLKAVRTFFEQDGGRKLTMDEIKALTPEDRFELSELAGKALGVEINREISKNS
jgi:hypothetical protein